MRSSYESLFLLAHSPVVNLQIDTRFQSRRPDATTCLLHPYLWDADKMLAFLQETSDRLQKISKESLRSLRSLENGGEDVVGNDWCRSLHPEFIAHFNKRRAYNGTFVRDLLRLMRNAVRPLPAFIFASTGTASDDPWCAYPETSLPRTPRQCAEAAGDSIRGLFEVFYRQVPEALPPRL